MGNGAQLRGDVSARRLSPQPILPAQHRKDEAAAPSARCSGRSACQTLPQRECAALTSKQRKISTSDNPR